MTSAHHATKEPPVATTDEQSAEPLRIVRGHASAAELAALVAVLAGAGVGGDAGASGEGGTTGVSIWAARDRLVRSGLQPGPGRWRASALPH
jgi:hypothetical protein